MDPVSGWLHRIQYWVEQNKVGVVNKRASGEENLELNQYLANYLLSLKPGEKLLNVRQLAKGAEASTGSISRVLNALEESGAITINRRGRLGSFLEAKSLGELWSIVADGPMVISLTMPSYPKIDGLATALYCLLNNAGVETYLIFIRGSYNRLKALRNGHCHAAVMSVVAAEELCGRREEVILRFPPESFLTDHQVFEKKSSPEATKPLRVGIEYDSFDLKYLTELEFEGIPVEYHQVTLMQIGRLLQEALIDAAIWNSDHMKPFLDDTIVSRPLSPHVRQIIGERDTSAAVLVRSSNLAVKTILGEILKPQKIMEIQAEVIKGEMVPRY